MLARCTSIVVLSLLLAGCASAPASRAPAGAWDDGAWTPAPVTASLHEDEGGGSSHGIGHRLLLWIPNRVFDVLDIVRARVRLGPGFAVSVHATQALGAQAGFYSAVWVGVPGPRLEPEINWPLGVETVAKAGATIVGADASVGNDGVPYGYGEVEFGLQAALVGFDVGVDVVEVLDLVVGILTFDITGDDL